MYSKILLYDARLSIGIVYPWGQRLSGSTEIITVKWWQINEVSSVLGSKNYCKTLMRWQNFIWFIAEYAFNDIFNCMIYSRYWLIGIGDLNNTKDAVFLYIFYKKIFFKRYDYGKAFSVIQSKKRKQINRILISLNLTAQSHV